MSPLRQSILHSLKILLFYSLLYIAFFSPVLLSHRLLTGWEGLIYYVPAFNTAPTLWTGYILSGFPIAADPQVQMWYPLKLLFYQINSFNSFVVSAYILASSFTYAYVFTLTRSRFASLSSGIIYGMSGFMMAHLGHTTIIHTAVWIPLFILALERLRHTYTAHWLVVASLSVSCSALAGHPQIFLYGLTLGIAYASVLGWSVNLGHWKYYCISIIAVVFGLASAAIQLLPTAELMALGLRTQMSFNEFASYSLPSYQIIGLLFPYLMGGIPGSFYNVPYFGEWNLTELTGYIGFLPLLVTVIAVASSYDKRMTWFWLVSGLIGLLLTFGDRTPLAKLLYYIPLYNKFKVPARHIMEMSLAFSVLAGIGIAAIIRKLTTFALTIKVTIIATMIVLIGLLNILAFKNHLKSAATSKGVSNVEFYPWSNPAVGVPLAVFALTCAVFVSWSRQPWSNLRQSLLLAVLIIDLASFGWFYEWQYWSPSKYLLIPTSSAQRYSELLHATSQRLLPIRGGWGTVPEMPPNLSSLWRVPSASGYGPMILARVSKLLSMSTVGNVADSWASASDRSLDIMAIRYVILSRPYLQAQPHIEISLADNSRWQYIEDIEGALIYENSRAMPRAWIVSEVLSLQPEQILQAIRTSHLPDGRLYDPAQTALVEDSLAFKTENHDPSTAIIKKLSATQMKIRIASATPVFLVMSDVYYPGWKATIDGLATPLVKTNYILHGVFIPEGAHMVKLVFRPLIFYVGSFITGGSICTLLAFIIIHRYRNVQMV